jgi:hypothetical protein
MAARWVEIHNPFSSCFICSECNVTKYHYETKMFYLLEFGTNNLLNIHCKECLIQIIKSQVSPSIDNKKDICANIIWIIIHLFIIINENVFDKP